MITSLFVINSSTYIEWILQALEVVGVVMIITIIVNAAIYREQINNIVKVIKK